MKKTYNSENNITPFDHIIRLVFLLVLYLAMSRLGPAIARLFGLCLEVIFWLVEEAGDLDEWKFFCWLLEEGGDLFDLLCTERVPSVLFLCQSLTN